MIKRYSKQRELIYNTIMGTDSHPTAEYVYNTLKSEHPTLSLGTVYRNIRQLESAGLIIKAPSKNDKERFDARIDEHFHFICDECGELFDIDSNGIGKELLESIPKHGHQMDRITFTIHGRCLHCQNKILSGQNKILSGQNKILSDQNNNTIV